MPSQQGFAVALLNIRLVPDPILFRKARKVAKITEQHKKLASDMVETMDEHHGVGLAANQVGVLERIFPHSAKLEMFCRSPRDGWTVWGNESAAA